MRRIPYSASRGRMRDYHSSSFGPLAVDTPSAESILFRTPDQGIACEPGPARRDSGEITPGVLDANHAGGAGSLGGFLRPGAEFFSIAAAAIAAGSAARLRHRARGRA